MKKLSQIVAECGNCCQTTPAASAPIAVSAPDRTQPGNGISCLGVTNHLTPPDNIVINARNLFGSALGIVIRKSECGTGIKVNSSQFTSPQTTNVILDRCVYPGSSEGCSLRSYVKSCGLDKVQLVSLGQEYAVYFLPSDIMHAPDPVATAAVAVPEEPCEEALKYNLGDCEIMSLSESYDDEELEGTEVKDVIDIIDKDSKIKAAEKLAKLVAKEIQLPKNYYFKAVKDADGKESIALRFKEERRRPFGKTVEITRSLFNIFGSGDGNVWVGEFEFKDKADEEIKTLIENILKLLGAAETDDACVWTIADPNAKDDGDKKDLKDDDSKDGSNKGEDAGGDGEEVKKDITGSDNDGTASDDDSNKE